MHPDQEDIRKRLIERGRRHQELCYGQNDGNGQGYHGHYVGPFWKFPELVDNYREDPDRNNVSFHAKPNRQVRAMF